MAEHQGPRRHAACVIKVDGQDVTARVDPYLISVKVVDTFEGDFDTCALELDDRNAQLQIPRDGSSLVVSLGWSGQGPRPYFNPEFKNQPRSEVFGLDQEAVKKELPFGGPGMRQVFAGTITSIESGFTRRGGGRRMWIEAQSANSKGKGKQVQNMTEGKGQEDDASPQQASSGGGGGGGGGGEIPLQQVMQKVFSNAGLQIKMSPDMMNIKRDFWHVNESAHHLGQRMADEMGGYFKVSNGVGVLMGKNEDMGYGSGDAVWGVNLIGWRIKPFSGRAQYKEAGTKFFDSWKASWEGVQKSIGSGGGAPFAGASAAMNFIQPVANKDNGEQVNGGGEADSKQRRATGWVLLNGEPGLQAGGFITISGARPGVDGRFRMTEVEHNYQRGVGFTTRCNLADPQGYPGGYKSWPKEKPEEKKPNEFEQRFKGEPASLEAPATPPKTDEPIGA